MSRAGSIAKRTLVSFYGDQMTHHAAALTYYSLMSLFPALLLALSLLGLLGQYPETYDAILNYLRDVTPGSVVAPLDDSLRTTLQSKGHSNLRAGAPGPGHQLPLGLVTAVRFDQPVAATNQLRGGPVDPVGYELCTTTGAKGDGVRATRCFDIGETVMVGVIERRVAGNDSHATQVSRTKWVRHGGLGPKVNHSCSPNCGVRLNDSGACDFVAREPIAAGEEITFDYAMRNYSVEHFPGGCLCGSDICRGSITGWRDLSDDRKAAYRGLVAPYLLEIDRDKICRGRATAGGPAHRGT